MGFTKMENNELMTVGNVTSVTKMSTLQVLRGKNEYKSYAVAEKNIQCCQQRMTRYFRLRRSQSILK